MHQRAGRLAEEAWAVLAELPSLSQPPVLEAGGASHRALVVPKPPWARRSSAPPSGSALLTVGKRKLAGCGRSERAGPASPLLSDPGPSPSLGLSLLLGPWG